MDEIKRHRHRWRVELELLKEELEREEAQLHAELTEIEAKLGLFFMSRPPAPRDGDA